MRVARLPVVIVLASGFDSQPVTIGRLFSLGPSDEEKNEARPYKKYFL